MNATPIKKNISVRIRHLLRVTAAGLRSLPFSGRSPAQAAKNAYGESIGGIARAKGFRCGALVLFLTFGFLFAFAMDGAGLARAGTDGRGVPPAASSDNPRRPANVRPLPGHYIDGSVAQAWRLKEALYRHSSGRGFHLFSHGRPGELLLGDRWQNAVRIAAFVRGLPGFSGRETLNIYGCSFGAGEKGREAVRYLERALDVPVAASDDVTGRNGDWDLEVGRSASAVQAPGYTRSLQFVVSGSAAFVHSPRNEIQLTSNFSKNQSGAVMSKRKVNFRAPFTIAFRAFLGSRDGADGMAAVFHNDPDGAEALGLSGSALGAGGIQNGIALEFDTYIGGSENWGKNWWGREDHTSIWDTDGVLRNGAPRPESYLTTAIGHGNIEDGDWHDVEIRWDSGTQTLSYTLDGADAGSYTHGGTTDFVTTYFGGAHRVHFGVTGATGGYTNVQRVRFPDYSSLPFMPDNDSDGVADIDDIDDDNDGITDCVENGLYYAGMPDIFAFIGSASPVLPNQVKLTQDSPGQAGAVMSRRKIDFREPFTLVFQADFGHKDWNGADGMAMVFHNDPEGSAALGRGGSVLGAGGIKNGIALEFDTYINYPSEHWGPGYEWWEDHTSIWDTDNMVGDYGVESQSFLTTAIGHGDIEDGDWHDVVIRWDPATQTLSYTLDGANAGSYTHRGKTDFVTAYFGGAHMVHFGITAATGGYTNVQRIRFDDFDFCSLPLELDLDTDGDGLPNHQDLDSDADGISDLVESGVDDDVQQTGLDWHNDGELDRLFPVGPNGLVDIVEDHYGEGNGVTPRDTDNDGIADFIDRDSDGDDCPDAIEGHRRYHYGFGHDVPSFYFGDTLSDGSLDQRLYPADDRGRHDGTVNQAVGSAADSSVDACTACDSALSGNSDFDGDTVSDICDLDDDNDGITDCVEKGAARGQIAGIFAFSDGVGQIPEDPTQVRLTTDSQGKTGAAMSRGKIDFREPFTITFQAYFGYNDYDGGDGMAVVFHNDPDGSAALGRSGSALGAGGIQNGIALEFDTYGNRFENWSYWSHGSTWNDHTSIWDTDGGLRNGAPRPESYLTTAIGHGNIEDWAWHDVSVTWDPATEELSYTLDGSNAGSYTHSGTTDFVTAYFGGAHRVHFGITASSGDATNVQSIRFAGFDFCRLPYDLDSDGDGWPNHSDLNSDNDGIWDLVESGADHATLDVNNDGKIDTPFPVGPDGLADAIEAANGDNNGTTPRDTNNDGFADFVDPDS